MDLLTLYNENDVIEEYETIYIDDEKENNKSKRSYKILHCIGKGVYGIVYKANCLNNSTIVALKQTYQKNANSFKEIEIMKKLKHPNIIKLKHAFYTITSNGVYVHMIMEYGIIDLSAILYHVHINANKNNKQDEKNIKTNFTTNTIDNKNFINKDENNINISEEKKIYDEEICKTNLNENEENNKKDDMENIDDPFNSNMIPRPRNNSTKVIYINDFSESIMNTCPCHNLSEFIKKNYFNQNQIKIFIYQLIRATLYLHSLSITHRDIKPQNILIFENKFISGNNENEKECIICLQNSIERDYMLHNKNKVKNEQKNKSYINGYKKYNKKINGTNNNNKKIDMNDNFNNSNGIIENNRLNENGKNSNKNNKENFDNEKNNENLYKVDASDKDKKRKIQKGNITYKYIKLCDFNTSIKLKENYKYFSYICSRYYRAPELLFGSNYYTQAIDTWSIGCVLGELILGKPMFLGECTSDQLVEIIKVLGTPNDEDFLSLRSVYKNVKFPDIKPLTLSKLFDQNCSKSSIELLEALLQFNPKKRIKLCHALLHRYFDDIRNLKAFENFEIVNNSNNKYCYSYNTNCFNFTKEELLHYTIEERKKLIPLEIRQKKIDEVTEYINMSIESFDELYPNRIHLS